MSMSGKCWFFNDLSICVARPHAAGGGRELPLCGLLAMRAAYPACTLVFHRSPEGQRRSFSPLY